MTRVLIVDDAAALRLVLRAFFTGLGCEVVGELASGGGVAEAVARLKPELVCLDYNLPDADGIGLLRAIHAEHPAVAVVMITGDLSPELEADAAEAGAAGFVRKPFTQERMAVEVRQILQAQDLHKRFLADQSHAVKQARARAVVVDDSVTMRRLLASILRHARVDVVGEAADGRQAIEVVAQRQPDLVCLDVDMPVMNGLDALPQMLAACPQARVLMVTARAGREMVAQAAQRGAKGYLLKPFFPEKVVEAVDRLLAAPSRRD
ncbi:MAG: response regulator [Pseudomonadota bacterium]